MPLGSYKTASDITSASALDDETLNQFTFVTSDYASDYVRSFTNGPQRSDRRETARPDDTLVAYIASPIWFLLWIFTFGCYGRPMYGRPMGADDG